MSTSKSFGYAIGSNAYIKEVMKVITKKRKRDVSEQVKTPGQVCYEVVCELFAGHWSTVPWSGLDESKRIKWESAAIAAHTAVEEQRKRLCAGCRNKIPETDRALCNSCRDFFGTMDVSASNGLTD